MFNAVARGLGRSFPDGTSTTLLFSEKRQVCGSGTALTPNYWFG